MQRALATFILAAFTGASTGCTMMSDVGDNMSVIMRQFRPRPFDETTDPSEREKDEWAGAVSEVRPASKTEREPSRFWWNKIMSPEARSIERNLGFE